MNHVMDILWATVEVRLWDDNLYANILKRILLTELRRNGKREQFEFHFEELREGVVCFECSGILGG